MKVITEALIRQELKATEPEVYYIPEGKILSPAAREYLNQMQVEIDFEKNRQKREEKKATSCNTVVPQESTQSSNVEQEYLKPKYVDYETGATYTDKPEHMTQLYGNFLVDKNHPRIRYRGKLDSLQADVVYAQTVISTTENSQSLLDDLDDILLSLRELMKSEVLEMPFTKSTIIGLTHAELRERSHDPLKFYNIKQMYLANYTMGITHSLLNLLRTRVRETELVAVEAFKEKRKVERTDIIQELNRLSSAIHIIMCKYLAGEYTKKS